MQPCHCLHCQAPYVMQIVSLGLKFIVVCRNWPMKNMAPIFGGLSQNFLTRARFEKVKPVSFEHRHWSCQDLGPSLIIKSVCSSIGDFKQMMKSFGCHESPDIRKPTSKKRHLAPVTRTAPKSRFHLSGGFIPSFLGHMHNLRRSFRNVFPLVQQRSL